MYSSTTSLLVTALVTVGALAVYWIWTLNRVMNSIPPEVLAVTPERWTKQQVLEAYKRAQTNPIDWASRLPPKLPRRYIVTGGSGGVGGELVLQLLLRGQEPESIRSLDIRTPQRADLLTGRAAGVDHVVADLTSSASTQAAVSKPWPAAMARRPLTVFHVAALIDPSRRSLRAYESVRRVNVEGTRHMLAAAQAAGADVFICCSSASVGLWPMKLWRGWPTAAPEGFAQFLTEADQDQPLRKHGEFFGNYGYSKAAAERLVCEANSPSFRTGSIRPANGIYGNSASDQVVGPCLRRGTVSSWIVNIVQNFVHAGNVSLGHLLLEAALAADGPSIPACAGRAFQVTDEGPPPTFGDVYDCLAALTHGAPIHVTRLQPALLFLISYIVEAFDVASRLPVLKWVVPAPRGDLAMLQPAVFTVSSHTPATDDVARKSVKDGGIGYRPVCTTLDGIAQQVLIWNREQAEAGAIDKDHVHEPSIAETIVDSIKHVGTGPAAVGA